jgi:hypothetical protein
VRNWIRNIEQHAQENVSKTLVATKADMTSERVVSTERGQKLAEEYGMPFFEVSSKSNADETNVNRVFMTLAEKIIQGIDEKGESKNFSSSFLRANQQIKISSVAPRKPRGGLFDCCCKRKSKTKQDSDGYTPLLEKEEKKTKSEPASVPNPRSATTTAASAPPFTPVEYSRPFLSPLKLSCSLAATQPPKFSFRLSAFFLSLLSSFTLPFVLLCQFIWLCFASCNVCRDCVSTLEIYHRRSRLLHDLIGELLRPAMGESNPFTWFFSMTRLTVLKRLFLICFFSFIYLVVLTAFMNIKPFSPFSWSIWTIAVLYLYGSIILAGYVAFHVSVPIQSFDELGRLPLVVSNGTKVTFADEWMYPHVVKTNRITALKPCRVVVYFFLAVFHSLLPELLNYFFLQAHFLPEDLPLSDSSSFSAANATAFDIYHLELSTVPFSMSLASFIPFSSVVNFILFFILLLVLDLFFNESFYKYSKAMRALTSSITASQPSSLHTSSSASSSSSSPSSSRSDAFIDLQYPGNILAWTEMRSYLAVDMTSLYGYCSSALRFFLCFSPLFVLFCFRLSSSSETVHCC